MHSENQPRLTEQTVSERLRELQNAPLAERAVVFETLAHELTVELERGDREAQA